MKRYRNTVSKTQALVEFVPMRYRNALNKTQNSHEGIHVTYRNAVNKMQYSEDCICVRQTNALNKSQGSEECIHVRYRNAISTTQDSVYSHDDILFKTMVEACEELMKTTTIWVTCAAKNRSLTPGHYATKYVGFRYCYSGDIKFLICQVILQGHVSKGSCNFINASPYTVSHHPTKFSGHKHCGSGDYFLVCHMTTCHHLFKGLCDFMSHHLAMFGGYWFSGSRDVMDLVCHVILQDHVTLWVKAFHGNSPPCLVWWP